MQQSSAYTFVQYQELSLSFLPLFTMLEFISNTTSKQKASCLMGMNQQMDVCVCVCVFVCAFE